MEKNTTMDISIDFIYEYLKKRRCRKKDKSISQNEIPIKIGKKYFYYVSLHQYEYSEENPLNKKSLIISDRVGEITTYKRFLDKEETVLYNWKNYIRINEYMSPIIGSVNRFTIITSVQINEEGFELINFFMMICKKFNLNLKNNPLP